MANHKCINGTLDGATYSSPVPVIGLYIAAASLFCMFFMLYDIVAGFRARKRWLPCKLFTLNSVTLTLLSVAAKLPVDLTTPMPSPQDQMSKLTATTLICITVGFLMPSLGLSAKSECFTNMVALTIFLVTVLVNVCIQISTGVIVLFVAEHIAILCCMMLLLMVLWSSYCDITACKKMWIDRKRKIFTVGDKSMIEQLKESYLLGYVLNPQLVVCTDPPCVVCGIICTLCSVILLQAAFRSLILKRVELCLAISDYDWSIPIIVVTQILTVMVGNFAVLFRWLTLSKHIDYDFSLVDEDTEVEFDITMNPILGRLSIHDKYLKLLQKLFFRMIILTEFLIVWVPRAASVLFWRLVGGDTDSHISPRGFSERKSLEDMERWMHMQSKSNPPEHLWPLLSRRYPSQQVEAMKLRDEAYPNIRSIKVSTLSIVLLARIAEVSLSDKLLMKIYDEVHEIIYFVEKTTNSKTVENNHKLLYAKAVRAGAEFSSTLRKDYYEHQPGLDRANTIFKILPVNLPTDPIWWEIHYIIEFINRKMYSSFEDLQASVEQMFVDMVNAMLAQFPSAILKSLSDSTVEGYDQSVKIALGLVCKFESLNAPLECLSLPGVKASRLLTTEAHAQEGDNNVSPIDDHDENDVIV